jgi:hypothetical protein
MTAGVQEVEGAGRGAPARAARTERTTRLLDGVLVLDADGELRLA